MYKEEIALQIAYEFIRCYKKYDNKKYSRYNIENSEIIKKSKWWEHFIRATKYKYVFDDWTPYVWVKCQFEKYGKILPYQLYGKKAEEAFKEYKDKVTENKNDRVKQIVMAVVSSYNIVKNWCIKNNNGVIDYNKFFENNELKIKRNEISDYFLAICKPYQKYIIDKEKFLLKRAVVHKIKKLKIKLKEIMHDDFY